MARRGAQPLALNGRTTAERVFNLPGPARAPPDVVAPVIPMLPLGASTEEEAARKRGPYPAESVLRCSFLFFCFFAAASDGVGFVVCEARSVEKSHLLVS